MNMTPRWIPLILACLSWTPLAPAAELAYARDGSGVYGYKDTPKLPWCEYLVHDCDRPVPPRVNPGVAHGMSVPSDAVILFDGKDLNAWQTTDWRRIEGCIEAVNGELTSKQTFTNCQIHLEWLAPANFQGPWYNQGNNGVMLMGVFEIQIFDSYNEKIYPDGMAAAIYGQTPPLVNASRKPGEWQSYDIVFTAPVFADGQLKSPARVTLFHNAVLVHLEAEIHGETGHRIVPKYSHQVSQGPLAFSGHGCPVRFRNVWVRPLP